ncbi:MAG: tyrosine-type recombinase/integrase, partial [bacterium]
RDEYGNLHIVNWIDTSLKEEEIPALTREEVEILASACSTKYKAVVKALFDSGARIEEFLNLTIGDLSKKDDYYKNYYKIRIRHSKTKPRTISIPMCTEELENWLRIHPDRKNLGAYLFPITYGAIRMELKRKGKKILGKNVTPHILRLDFDSQSPKIGISITETRIKWGFNF